MPFPAYLANATNEMVKSRTNDANGDPDPYKVKEFREKDPQMAALWVAGSQYMNARNEANPVGKTEP